MEWKNKVIKQICGVANSLKFRDVCNSNKRT